MYIVPPYIFSMNLYENGSNKSKISISNQVSKNNTSLHRRLHVTKISCLIHIVTKLSLIVATHTSITTNLITSINSIINSITSIIKI